MQSPTQDSRGSRKRLREESAEDSEPTPLQTDLDAILANLPTRASNLDPNDTFDLTDFDDLSLDFSALTDNPYLNGKPFDNVESDSEPSYTDLDKLFEDLPAAVDPYILDEVATDELPAEADACAAEERSTAVEDTPSEPKCPKDLALDKLGDKSTNGDIDMQNSQAIGSNNQAIVDEVFHQILSLGKWKSDDRTQSKIAKIAKAVVDIVSIDQRASMLSFEDLQSKLEDHFKHVLGLERIRPLTAWLTQRFGGKRLDIQSLAPKSTSTVNSISVSNSESTHPFRSVTAANPDRVAFCTEVGVKKGIGTSCATSMLVSKLLMEAGLSQEAPRGPNVAVSRGAPTPKRIPPLHPNKAAESSTDPRMILLLRAANMARTPQLQKVVFAILYKAMKRPISEATVLLGRATKFLPPEALDLIRSAMLVDTVRKTGRNSSFDLCGVDSVRQAMRNTSFDIGALSNSLGASGALKTSVCSSASFSKDCIEAQQIMSIIEKIIGLAPASMRASISPLLLRVVHLPTERATLVLSKAAELLPGEASELLADVAKRLAQRPTTTEQAATTTTVATPLNAGQKWWWVSQK